MFGSCYKQMYVTFGLSLIGFTTGYNMGLTSIIIPKLREEGSGLKLSLDQESWLISISLPILWLGLTVLSFLMSVIGRKYCVLIAILPVICANIGLAFATSYTALAAGQCFAALGGAGTIISGHFIGEFSSPRLRGFLLAFKGPIVAAGFMVPHIFITLSMPWRTISLIATAPMILAFLIITSSYDSPTWLAAKGKLEKCKKSYNWYRGDQEREELEDLIRIRGKDVHLKREKFRHFNEIKMYLLDKKFLRALGICIACSLMIDCSGKQIFANMCVDITSRILGHELHFNVMYFLLSLDLAELITYIFVCILAKKFKRRTLLFVLTPISLVFLFTFCLLSFLISRGILSGSYSWVSFLFLMAYFLMQLPTHATAYTLIYEVYPYSHKSIAMMFQNACLISLLFVFLKLSPGWLVEYGAHGTFLLCGLVVIASLIILYYLMPETSDKTLLNIEKEMEGNKVSKVDCEQAAELNELNNKTAQA